MSPLSAKRNAYTFLSVLLFLIYIVVVVYIVSFVGFLLWQNSGDDTAPWSPEDHTTRYSGALRTRARVDVPAREPFADRSSLTACDSTPIPPRTSRGDDVIPRRYRSNAQSDVIVNVESPTLPDCRTPRGSANTFQTVAGKHYVFSAYYDDRLVGSRHTDSHLAAVVRIIALLHNQNSLLSMRPSPTIYCHTWTGRVHYSSAVEYYEMCENHGKQYGGWILTCRLPPPAAGGAAVPPCVVGVSTDANESGADMVTMDVFRTMSTRSNKTSRGKLAVCVPPIFGHVSSKTLVEFIELSRMISADHLIFYWSGRVNSTTRALSDTFRYYRKTGLVSVVNWTLPDKLLPPGTQFVHAGKVWYYGQLTAINDCLYRTMHAFNHVAFNDIDEFIIPRDTRRRLSALLREIESRKSRSTGSEESAPYCAYSFRSAFFDPMSVSSGVTPATDVVEYELESDVRSALLSGVRSKVVVEPLRVFELGIHHVSRPLEDGQCPVHHVDPSDAIIHHYRQCVADFDVRIDCSRQCVDDTLTRSGLVQLLRQRVQRTLRLIKTAP